MEKKFNGESDISEKGQNDSGEDSQEKLESENTAGEAAPLEEHETRRVEINSGMTVREIMEKYDVSRSTAWRALKRAEENGGRGWLVMNYHRRQIEIDPEWAEKNVDKINEFARIGAAFAVKKFNKTNAPQHIFLSPYEFEDLVSVARLRMLELTGVKDKREDNHWLVGIAIRAAMTFIKSKIFTPRDHALWISDDEIERRFAPTGEDGED